MFNQKITTMKKYAKLLLMLAVVGMAMSCDKDWNDINPRKVQLTNVNLECIEEIEGAHDPMSGREYTHHRYKCTGSLDGFAGSCYIVISEPIMGECARSREIIVNKNKTDFAFTFTNKGAHTDLEHFNYTIQVVDKFDYVICQTTIIASKHPDNE
jgi:hypothetical protein